jgi:hypothetical protein
VDLKVQGIREFFWDVEQRVAAAALLGTFDQGAVRSILNRFGCTVSEKELSLDAVTSSMKSSSLRDVPIRKLTRAISRDHSEHFETFYRLVTFNDGGGLVDQSKFSERLNRYLDEPNLWVIGCTIPRVWHIVAEDAHSDAADHRFRNEPITYSDMSRSERSDVW